MKYALGIDIGGTKLSVTAGDIDGGNLEILGKRKIATPRDGGYRSALERISEACEELMGEVGALCGIGISCGGPLDSVKGRILSPPNLVGWNDVPIVEYFEERFKVPVKLRNDADACVLAEWKFGAGRGLQNLVFLTFGTGLGAGLILNGKLYSGTNDMAGEIGHCRSPIVDASHYAPVGYGKAGSFEGYCSGGGLADMGRSVALERIQMGKPAAFCPNIQGLGQITAKSLGDAAEAGDEAALEVYRCSGRHLGAMLAFLADVLNPELIIIGSIYARSERLLRDSAMEVFRRECLSRSLCRVVPAELGEELGDVAAIGIVSAMEDASR